MRFAAFLGCRRYLASSPSITSLTVFFNCSVSSSAALLEEMLGKIGKEKRRGGEDRLKVKQRGVAFGVVEEGVSGADVFRVLGFPEDDSKRQIAVGAFALQILVRERPAFLFVSGPPILFFLRKALMRRAFWRSPAHHDSSRRGGRQSSRCGGQASAGLLVRRRTNGEQEAQDD